MDTEHPRLTSATERYDPWRHLQRDWPDVQIVVEPMPGRLLGWLRYPVIALRAGTSAAQRRCTLAHEIVHLERGVSDCGPWAVQEERHVHATAARRLISWGDLISAVAEFGPADDRVLAHALDVDRDTMRARLDQLSAAERRALVEQAQDLWSVA